MPKILLFYLLLLMQTAASASPPDDAFYKSLAFHHAPIHHQSYNKKHYRSDLVLRIDFDGDWDSGNNWKNLNLPAADLSGAVYYSVAETASHWFILYLFFHPRDYKRFFEVEFEHENDMEGMVLMVRKDGSAFGKAEALTTRSHSSILPYYNAVAPLPPHQRKPKGAFFYAEDLQGQQRILTYQEAGGHGFYAFQPGKRHPKQRKNMIVYYPSADADVAPPTGKEDTLHYRLIDVFEPGGFWSNRNNPLTFNRWGDFHNTRTRRGTANAPWIWSDRRNPASVPRGAMALDPAALFDALFVVERLEKEYIFNPYVEE